MIHYHNVLTLLFYAYTNNFSFTDWNTILKYRYDMQLLDIKSCFEIYCNINAWYIISTYYFNPPPLIQIRTIKLNYAIDYIIIIYALKDDQIKRLRIVVRRGVQSTTNFHFHFTLHILPSTTAHCYSYTHTIYAKY